MSPYFSIAYFSSAYFDTDTVAVVAGHRLRPKPVLPPPTPLLDDGDELFALF